MNKKFIVMAAMAAVFGMSFTACSNEEDAGKGNVASIKSDGSIGFSTNFDKVLSTRGAEASNTTLQTDGFRVWAYNATTPATVMDGVDVSYAAGAWGYGDDLYYWPTNGDLLKFQAITPYAWAVGTGATNGNATVASTSTSTVVTDLVIPACASQRDLMFARQGTAAGINLNGEDVTTAEGKVDLTFQHALSQIVFKGYLENKAALKQATVAEISICQVNSKGTITFAQDLGSLSYNGISSAPASPAVNANYTAGLVSSPVVGVATKATADATTNAINLSATDGALMLLPQVITATTVGANAQTVPTAGTYLKIAATIIDQNDNVLIDAGAAGSRNYYYVPINAITWNPGYKYTYIIKFTANQLTPIVFGDCTVGAWTDANGDPNPVEF